MSSQSLKSNQKKEIPKDWRNDFFGNYFDIFSGIGFKKSEYTKHGIKLLRIDNVSYETITWESEAYLPLQYLKKFPKIVLEEGDILLALNRPITNGKLKIAILEKKDTPCILYQRVGKITILNPNDDKKFLFYVLQKYIKKFVEDTSVGTDQPFISTTKLKKLKLLLPTNSKEQFLIGKTLSDANELIKQLDYLITKKKNIKQGAMQELLTGKKRLEGFNEKWKEKILPDIGKIISGGTPSSLKKEYWNGDVLWAVPTDITKLTNNYIEDTERKITSIGLQESSSELLPIGTILITSRATIGECAIAKKPICTNQGFQNLVCNNKFDNIFIFYSILQNKKKLNEFTAGSTFKEISKKQMEKISILVPIDISEQEEIAKILSDMDSEIKELETKRDKYIMIKNGMMQKLLTGEIRLT